MFVEHNLINLGDVLISKRTENRFTTLYDFFYKEDYEIWTQAVEEARIAIIDCAVCVLEKREEQFIKPYITVFFEKYRKVLSFFTNKSMKIKLKPTINDYDSILIMTGKGVSTRAYKNREDFLPSGKHTFRRDLENYIADYLTVRMSMTEEEIQNERILKNRKKKNGRAIARKKQQTKDDTNSI